MKVSIQLTALMALLFTSTPALPLGLDLALHSDSMVTAYYYGKEAVYTNTLVDLTLGRSTTLFANNPAPAHGQAFFMGRYASGTELVFCVNVLNSGKTYYSGNAHRNADRVSHVRTSTFSGNRFIPPGIRVGFEDLWGGGDRDYDDITFVLVATPLPPAVDPILPTPEPATLGVVILGGLLGAARRLIASAAARRHW